MKRESLREKEVQMNDLEWPSKYFSTVELLTIIVFETHENLPGGHRSCTGMGFLSLQR